MKTPIDAFWQLSGFVPRIYADEHKQLLEVLTASKSAEGAEAAFESLNRIAPDPVKLSAHAHVALATLDKGGLNELRGLQG